MPHVNKIFPLHVKRIKVISLTSADEAWLSHKKAIGKEATIDVSLGEYATFKVRVCSSCGKALSSIYIDEYIDLDDPEGNYQ